jgi:hypothetical protein
MANREQILFLNTIIIMVKFSYFYFFKTRKAKKQKSKRNTNYIDRSFVLRKIF